MHHANNRLINLIKFYQAIGSACSIAKTYLRMLGFLLHYKTTI